MPCGNLLGSFWARSSTRVSFIPVIERSLSNLGDVRVNWSASRSSNADAKTFRDLKEAVRMFV